MRRRGLEHVDGSDPRVQARPPAPRLARWAVPSYAVRPRRLREGDQRVPPRADRDARTERVSEPSCHHRREAAIPQGSLVGAFPSGAESCVDGGGTRTLDRAGAPAAAKEHDRDRRRRSYPVLLAAVGVSRAGGDGSARAHGSACSNGWKLVDRLCQKIIGSLDDATTGEPERRAAQQHRPTDSARIAACWFRWRVGFPRSGGGAECSQRSRALSSRSARLGALAPARRRSAPPYVRPTGPAAGRVWRSRRALCELRYGSRPGRCRPERSFPR